MGTACAPLVDDLFLFSYDFYIVNFPFLAGDIPRSTSYGVYISQIIRFFECLVMMNILILVIKF